MSTDFDPETQRELTRQDGLSDTNGGDSREGDGVADKEEQVVWLRAVARRLIAQASRIESRIKAVLGQREE